MKRYKIPAVCVRGGSDPSDFFERLSEVIPMGILEKPGYQLRYEVQNCLPIAINHKVISYERSVQLYS